MISLLYIDDEPGLLELGQLFLESDGGFRVITALSGAEGLMHLASQDFDAIVSDYQMPEMNGLELLKNVRKSFGNIPFILFTGRGREEVVIEAINIGVDFYLQKGGDPKAQFAELSHKVRQAVNRRRAETALSDSERRLADIINFLPDATFAIDTRGTVIAWNRAMEQMTGVRSEDVLGKGNYAYALPFYHERRPLLINLVLDDDPAIAEKYPFVKREGKTLFSEITIPHFNEGKGAALWFTASPLYDRKGEMVGAIESIREITDRKRAEDDLVSANREYTNLLDQIQDVYYRSDNEGRLVRASRSWATLFGYDDLSECIGMRVADDFYVNPSDRNRLLEEIRQNGKVTGYQVLLKKKDGTPVLIEASSHLYFDPAGNVIGIEGTFRDITERKKVEDELRAANEQLVASDEELRAQYEELALSEKRIRMSETRLTFMLGFYEYARKSEKELLAYAIEGAGIVTGSPLGYLAFLNGDESELSMYAWSKNAMAECSMTEKPIIYKTEKTGLWGEAVRQRQPVITNDYNAPNPAKKGYPKGHPHIIRHMNIPVIDDGHIVLVAGVANKPGDYTENDTSELILLMQALWAILKRRRAEETRLESEAKYRTLFETADEGIWTIDAEFRSVSANLKMQEMFGYTGQEMMGRPVWDFVPPGDAESVKQELFKRPRGVPGRYERRWVRKDGTVIWCFTSATPLFSPEGTFIGSFGMFTDITERRQMEEALRESEEKFRAVIDQSFEFIGLMTPDGILIEANRAALALIDIAESEVLHRPFWETPWWSHSPELREKLRDAIRRAASGEIVRFEASHPTGNGHVITVDFSVKPVVDGQGRIQYLIPEGRDITERKRAEDELRLTKISQDRSSDEVFWMDFAGNFLYVNDAACRTTGYSREELLRMKLFELDPDFPQEVWEASVADLRQRKTQFITTRHRRKDGVMIDVEIVTVYVNQDDREYSFAYVREVTERKRTEDALRESEEKYRTLVESSFDGIAIHQDGILVYVNRTAARLLGAEEPEVFIGRPAIDIVAPTFRKQIVQRVEQAPESSQELIREQFLRLDGTPIDVDVTTTPSIWKGRPAGYVTFRDITAQVRAEEALEKRLVALTQPLAVTEIAFEDLFNIEEIQRLQDEYAKATGVAVLLTRPDGTPITKPSNFCRLCSELVRSTEKGRERCRVSDSVLGDFHEGGPYVHTCLSAGLWGAGTNIVLGGRHIANWLIGQVRNETQTEEGMRTYARELGVDEEDFIEAFLDVPVMSSERFESVAQSLSTLANQLSRFAYQNVQQARFITERKRNEDALRDSEEKYRTLVEVSHDIIYTMTMGGIILYVSPQVIPQLGYRPEEMEGKEFMGFIHPDDAMLLLGHIQEHFDAGKPVRPDRFRVRRKDGGYRWFEDTTIYATDREGRQIVAGTIRDVTEEKAAQDALHESEEKYRMLVEQSRDGVFIIQDGRLVFYNKALTGLSGYSAEELDGRLLADLVAPEDRQTVVSRAKARADGKSMPEMYEFSLLHKDNNRRIRVRVSAGQGSYKGRPASIGMFYDVTEDRRREGALRESEEKFRALVETTSDFIWEVDTAGKYTYVSPQVHRILGYEPEELTGMTPFDLMPAEEAERVAAEFNLCITSRLPITGLENKALRKDGSVVILETSGIVRTAEDGRYLGYRGIDRDITKRKEAELALHEKTEELNRFFTTTLDLFCIAGTDGYFRRLNPEWEKALGYSLKELEGHRFLDFVHPDDYQSTLAAVADLAAQKAVVNFTNRYRHRDGTYRWIEWRSLPVGALIFAAARDITARHDAAERTGQISALKQDLLRTAPLEEKMKRITDGVVDIFGADFARIWIAGPGDFCSRGCIHAAIANGAHVCRDRTSCLHLIVSSGRYTHTDGGHRRVPFGAYKIGRIATGDEAMFITNDVTHDPRVHDHAWAESLGLKSFAGFRLVSPEGVPVGVLAFFSRQPVLPEVMEDLSDLATTASQVIQTGMVEQALRESEARLSSILQGSPVLQFVIDSNHRVISWNTALEEYSGIRAADIIGTDLQWRAFYPKKRPVLADLLVDGNTDAVNKWYTGKFWKSRYIEGAIEATDFFPRMGSSGTWLSFTAAPIRDAGGRIIGAVESLEDITERMNAENALRESEERARTILNTAQAGIILVDAAAHEIIDANNKALELIGLPRESVIGSVCHRFICPAEEGKCPVTDSGQQVDTSERVLIAADGSQIPVLKTVVPVTLADRNILVESFVDISGHKRSETAIREANRKLNLLSSITRHDVANQLTAVQGYTQLAGLQKPGPAVADYLGRIASAVETIQHQIEFTKEYQELGVHAPGWFGVGDMIRGAKPKKVRLRCTCDPLEVFADPMIGRVFFNLFDNAIRYGGKVTTITAGCKTRGNDLVITFSDNGVGIPPGEKEKIFEKGYGQNTGFGLFLAREILAITGITIHETGKQGRGARFEIIVPKGAFRNKE